MILDTVNENLCVNKLIASKKEILLVEGDMIVPDSKPDILNTISTSGVVCVYKKEILDEKIRLDGNINTYIMYLADDSQDKIRGINTSLDFSETINIPNVQTDMNSQIETKLKSIECKVINGRKIGIKATLEVDIKIYSKENVDVINDIQNSDGIQILKQNLKVNSLVGMGETKIYAKDTISIDNTDDLAEILKSNVCICNKDIKISYNKVLTKSEVQIKIMYLTEDNRIKLVTSKIPVVGFVDIDNVSEENICDVDYEIKNIVLKPNSNEEHSVYVEIEVGVSVNVYEEKQINLIQDLYSPIEKLEFDKKKINTMTDKKATQELKQIREKLILEDIDNKSIIDVDIIPNIEKEEKLSNQIIYQATLDINFIMVNQDLQVDMKKVQIPFEHIVQGIEECENINNELEIEIANQDFIVQDGGNVSANIDLLINQKLYRNTNFNVMNEIQTNGEREAEDYSLVMYIVKKDDTLWKIAKQFGSTIEDISRANGIEDENKIYPNQKLFIPRYARVGANLQKTPMIEYV